MDWKTLFLTANGRIGQRDFWIGFAILFVANLLVHFIPVLGQLIALALIYPGACLYSKRLHDFGRSGWFAAVPFVVFMGALVIGMIAGGIGVLAAAGAGGGAGAAAIGGLGLMALLMGLAFLVMIAFVLWVGLSKGDPATNRYGPPPVSLIDGPSPTLA